MEKTIIAPVENTDEALEADLSLKHRQNQLIEEIKKLFNNEGMKGEKNMSYPNQRIIDIHRNALGSNFLGISNDNWRAAARDLGATAFLFYIYLASNANGFRLELSPKAMRNSIGLPESTYHDQFKLLVKKGYLVPKGNGKTYFDFYECPKKEDSKKVIEIVTGAADEEAEGADEKTPHVDEKAQTVASKAGDIREIYNKYGSNIPINNYKYGAEKKQVSFQPHNDRFVF